MPRIVKILAVAFLLLLAWVFLRSSPAGNGAAPEGEPSGVVPSSPLEALAHSIVRQIYPEATLVMRHTSPVDGSLAHFLYYSPVPRDPGKIVSYLRSSRASIKRVVEGSSWYVSAVLSVEGNSVLVDFYPDYEKNRLVVMVR